MIKSTINCSENGCCDHVQKYKKLECLCWEEGGSWDGCLAAVWERRVGMGKKKGKRKRVSAEWVYIGFYRWNHLRNVSVGIPVGESAGDCATSLYGDPGLNPSVIPSVKSSEKNPRHHTVATFQKNYIICRRYGRYIPTVSLTEIVCRYIPTELPMKKFRW